MDGKARSSREIRTAFVTIAARFSSDTPSATLPDEVELRRRYVAMDAWPADARLGLLLLTWMWGPGFASARIRRAVNALTPDFGDAADAARASAKMGVGQTPTLISAIPLTGIARAAFENAALVVRWNLDPDVLYWPTELARCAGATVIR